MDILSIRDDFPVHVGNAVLQQSKLHFLRFVYFLWEHVVPGSIKLVYCDTDSIGKLYYIKIKIYIMYICRYVYMYIYPYIYMYIYVY